MSKHGSRLGKKFIAISGIVGLSVLGLGGWAVAEVVAANKVEKYGVCVNKQTGALRALERNNLSKSQYGKCKVNETKIFLKEGTWVPTKLDFKYQPVVPSGSPTPSPITVKCVVVTPGTASSYNCS